MPEPPTYLAECPACTHADLCPLLLRSSQQNFLRYLSPGLLVSLLLLVPRMAPDYLKPKSCGNRLPGRGEGSPPFVYLIKNQDAGNGFAGENAPRSGMNSVFFPGLAIALQSRRALPARLR